MARRLGVVLTGTRVALALGSGGARGYTHIGVIQVLQERGCDIVAVAGSSMGALVGGVHAAGKLDEYTEWATGLGQFEILRLLDIAIARPGAIRGERVFARLQELIGDVDIEDLPIPYTAVAADLRSRREVWFQRGPLVPAIRASAAIPSLFPPVESNGRLLADGGILNPVPLAPMASVHADLTVAVTLTGDGPVPELGLDRDVEAPYDQDDVDADDGPDDRRQAPVAEARIDRIRARASRLFDRDARSTLPDADDGADTDTGDGAADDEAAAEAPAPTPTKLGKFDVINLSLETMQAALTQHKLAGYPPDVLVSVPKSVCRTMDYHRAADMIAIGRHLTEQAIDRL
jgi:NTE family protein